MRKFIQNKLWRDKAPKLMRDTGSIIHVKDMPDEDYDKALKVKLEEEVREVIEASSKKELIEEIADVLEVIDSIYKLHDIDKNEVEEIKKEKEHKRGGFYNRQFVTVAEHKSGSFGEKYCLAQPEKYPEIV